MVPSCARGAPGITGQAESSWAAVRRVLEGSLHVEGNGDVFPESPVLEFTRGVNAGFHFMGKRLWS